jgi:hypothetical protein
MDALSQVTFLLSMRSIKQLLSPASVRSLRALRQHKPFQPLRPRSLRKEERQHINTPRGRCLRYQPLEQVSEYLSKVGQAASIGQTLVAPDCLMRSEPGVVSSGIASVHTRAAERPTMPLCHYALHVLCH